MRRGVFPHARAIEEFSSEQVGDDLVLFDPTRSTYHTLNSAARSIWVACNGEQGVTEIGSNIGVPQAVVESALADLEDAGLMQGGVMGVDRRALLKGALRVGAVGALVPVVVSMSAPDSASASTTCSYSGQCSSGCCQNSQTLYNCANAVRGTIGWENVSQEEAEEACEPVAGGYDFCTVLQTLYVTFDGVTIPFSNACK